MQLLASSPYSRTKHHELAKLGKKLYFRGHDKSSRSTGLTVIVSGGGVLRKATDLSLKCSAKIFLFSRAKHIMLNAS